MIVLSGERFPETEIQRIFIAKHPQLLLYHYNSLSPSAWVDQKGDKLVIN